jgi:hypothetical protein
MRTVPGVVPARYAEALQEFERIVGKENVYTSDEDLDLYRDGYSILWGEPEERIAAGAVAPASVEQVQASSGPPISIAFRFMPSRPAATSATADQHRIIPAASCSISNA